MKTRRAVLAAILSLLFSFGMFADTVAARDPFTYASGEQGQIKPKRILNGIVVSKGEKKALIGETEYKVGDTLFGYTITKIDFDHIEVESDSKRRSIRVDDIL